MGYVASEPVILQSIQNINNIQGEEYTGQTRPDSLRYCISLPLKLTIKRISSQARDANLRQLTVTGSDNRLFRVLFHGFT